MGQLIISEQDIINAICLFMSHEKDIEPDEVEVELIYDDEEEMAFTAETSIHNKTELIPTAKIIAALRLWIDLYTESEGISAGIKLHFNENDGIYASVW
ncbi:DUF2653 family protein [Sporosarcina pasteurii]|uniref:Protein of uncharacterized function (DUF2653) n=1 Tax=Sporosarcina pasteurii TaxID=1474 RepID=A0A380BHE9_SPOPA|nr:DUF2653 family protein [Sporosarcina pasteurii]MDS9470687.1 DUF2653 family protein [Sporosarcina pasteurii]QBQ05629.1 DUF2653 family protein [Sporosarcina pasteurii]SUJ01554.1 Protein of uncharacterised function (DUF2653) [Sporosarcina pasteurii]